MDTLSFCKASRLRAKSHSEIVGAADGELGIPERIRLTPDKLTHEVVESNVEQQRVAMMLTSVKLLRSCLGIVLLSSCVEVVSSKS